MIILNDLILLFSFMGEYRKVSKVCKLMLKIKAHFCKYEIPSLTFEEGQSP